MSTLSKDIHNQIKFRAWLKPSKNSVGRMIEVDEIWFSKNLLKEINQTEHSLADSILLRFTGLSDKSGKEIYEGDILKDDVGDTLEVKFGKLPLDKSGDCVCSYEAFYCKNYGQLGQSPSHECQNIGEWMEIIGNIYENPNLLKTN
jgi:uncharacterized phage protein (TIGR01671 family)